MYDLTALGELLVDFTECGVSENGMRLFEQNPGGAPANVVCGAARQGLRTAFIGKVGRDMHGEFLRRTLLQEGVDVSGLLETEEAFTTLAFVALDEQGERQFSFARKPGADLCLRQEELPRDLLERTKILHVGSLSLTDGPARSATLEAVRLAKSHGALISYDPNYRAGLWPDEKTARHWMRAMLPWADLVKVSAEELPLLTGTGEPEAGAQMLLSGGAKCAVVTLGRGGALGAVPGCAASAGAYTEHPAVDTTGAGDAFWAYFLGGLLERGIPRRREELMACLRRGNGAAALCVRRRGGIPALPARDEVDRFLKEHA